MAVKETVVEEDDFQREVLDINDASLMAGVEQEVDATDDWQARACPPVEGKYRLKLCIPDTSIIVGHKDGFAKNDPNGVYYQKEIQCKIQHSDPKIQDSVVGYKASTGISRGKKTSTMAGILVMAGFKVKPKINDLELATLFIKALGQKEPILIAETQWEAWDASDRNDIKCVMRGMANFPKNKDGKTHNHILTSRKGQEFVAKLKLKKWIGRATAVAAAAEAPKAAVAPKPPVKAAEVIEDDGFGVVSAAAVEMGADDEVILD